VSTGSTGVILPTLPPHFLLSQDYQCDA